MDHKKNNSIDAWDDGVYGTGNTMPPKSHSGIITLLLMAVIFLSGIVSILSFLNIRLFQQLSEQNQKLKEQTPMSFSDMDHHIAGTEPTISELPPVLQPDVSISLNRSPQSVENVPQEGALSLQEIYEKISPSVVSVLSSTDTGNVTGAGVVLSERGYILTTCLVVEGAETITIRFGDGQSSSAILIGADAVTDLAVLYMDAPDLIPVEFGDSEALRVGDSVSAIGDPVGAELSGVLTPGIVSAIHRDVLLNGQTISLIQTNAAVNPGDSGGPLINCYGQVIGINTTHFDAFSREENIQGITFAIPSTMVKNIVDQLIAQGYVSGRPTLGIDGDPVSRFDQYYFHIPAGLYISDVEQTSDAGLQGIEPGDILISIDGVPISDRQTLDTIVYSHAIGDQVTALVFRDGSEQQFTLTLSEYAG